MIDQPCPSLDAYTESFPSVRIVATYPATPWACPETVSVEWANPLKPPSSLDVSSAVAALAAVPSRARIDAR
jgi:hypothetical protein